MKVYLMIVAFVIGHLSRQCHGFLLADSCLAAPPCRCSGLGSSRVTVNCFVEGLNTTPSFQHVDIHVDLLSIRLFGNNIMIVPDNAFKNLSNINAISISIELDSNGFSSLRDNVFTGIEDEIKHLDLHNNNLSSIPSAVGKLKALEFLDISNNPLQSLGYSVMSNIGHTLQTFKLDVKSISVWPEEIGLLRSLQSLLIQTVPFASLKSNVFHSFENSLTSLTLQNAPLLERIPYAVCQLSAIQSLILSNFRNINQNGSSLFDHCQEERRSLNSLYLNRNQLDKFPNVLHLFPSLSTLDVRSNNLETIEADRIPSNESLSFLDLSQNHFKRIPAAVNKLTNLQTLYMVFNEIAVVADDDLLELTSLRSLYLSHNPIRYISNHAFKNNVRLSTLDLSYTKLVSIPLAISTLPNLITLNVQYGEHIPCTCDMAYLKGWNATSVRSFSGQCAYSSLSIQKFIMTSLQHCP